MVGNGQVQPAFAGNVPEVPIRVMDTSHIDKKLNVVYSKRVVSGNVGKGTRKAYGDYAVQATKNASSNKVVLGKFIQEKIFISLIIHEMLQVILSKKYFI